MTTHSTSVQINYVTQWFKTWSEFQKEDFTLVLSQKLSPKESVNITVNGMSNGCAKTPVGIYDSGRPPSLFTCQIKLFNEWWDSWTEDDRTKLTSLVKESDGKFWNNVESEVSGTRKKVEEEFYAMLERDALESQAFAKEVKSSDDPEKSNANNINDKEQNGSTSIDDSKDLNGGEMDETELIETLNISEGVTTILISGNESVEEPQNQNKPEGEEEIKD